MCLKVGPFTESASSWTDSGDEFPSTLSGIIGTNLGCPITFKKMHVKRNIKCKRNSQSWNPMVFMVSVLLKKEQWFHVGDTFVTLVLSGDPEKKWQESRKPEVQPAPSRSLATELPPPSYGTSVPKSGKWLHRRTPTYLIPKKWPRILKR